MNTRSTSRVFLMDSYQAAGRQHSRYFSFALDAAFFGLSGLKLIPSSISYSWHVNLELLAALEKDSNFITNNLTPMASTEDVHFMDEKFETVGIEEDDTLLSNIGDRYSTRKRNSRRHIIILYFTNIITLTILFALLAKASVIRRDPSLHGVYCMSRFLLHLISNFS